MKSFLMVLGRLPKNKIRKNRTTMKKYILSLMSAMVLMGMVSCSDEELVKGREAKAGELVIFSINKATLVLHTRM